MKDIDKEYHIRTQEFTLPERIESFAHVYANEWIFKYFGLTIAPGSNHAVMVWRVDHTSLDQLLVSQVNIDVLKNNQIHMLPAQQFVSQFNDDPTPYLSSQGDRVIVAAENSIKLYEYAPEKNAFVLAGKLAREEGGIDQDSIKLSDNGLTVRFRANHAGHADHIYELKFKK